VGALRALLEGQPGPAGRPGAVTGCTVQYGAPRDGIAGFTER
jgi:hypothetical protein